MTRKSALLVTGILCSLLVIGPANAAMGDVILSFNAKAQNSVGLTWVNGYLWNIDHGHYVPAKLLKLDPTDGSVLLTLTLPITHGMGLTWDGNSFWVVSHEDSVIYQINPNDGAVISSFSSPNPFTVETGCEGLAWDGTYLWYADSDLDTIYQLDPSDGSVVKSFPTPGSSAQGLAWDGSHLWHFDLVTGLIYKLSPVDGSVLTSFPAPGKGEGDLAWDGCYLWLSRNGADTVYKIDVGSVPPVADAGGDQTVYEGDIVQFDGSASYDLVGNIVKYEWDFDANMDSDGDGNPTNDIDATGPKPTHIYGDDGDYNVTLTVTNNQNLSDTDTCIVTVNNIAPTIEPFGPFVVNEGVPVTLAANATDPGSDDITFIWSWGDGTSDTITVYYNDGIGPDPYPSPWGTFPFDVTEIVQHIYDADGVYTINLIVDDDDGGVTVYTTNIKVIGVAPPALYINDSRDGRDVILYWDPPLTLGIDHYLIYRSTSQIDFDFNTVWVNTSIDNGSGESAPIPLRTMWNDTNAAFPGNDTNYEEQYYYTIRTVNNLGEVSRTSRTVGKWTTTFSGGVSTFSLPLEPLETMNKSVDYYLNDMKASYIKWMNQTTHTWMKHGDGGDNDTLLEVGRGYEVFFDSSAKYTFLGMPGAMIRYNTGDFVGFDYNTNAKTLQIISASSITGDVTLTWDPVLVGMDDDDDYYVYWATTRDGFDGSEGSEYILLDIVDYTAPTFATHSGALLLYPQLYYMVIPVNETGSEGASTYSIGIWTEGYLARYDTIGIPLRLSINYTADWYCDNIPNTVGINYYNVGAQRWCWHYTRMPGGAYDTILKMTEGYQISTSNATKYTFIGV